MNVPSLALSQFYEQELSYNKKRYRLGEGFPVNNLTI